MRAFAAHMAPAAMAALLGFAISGRASAQWSVPDNLENGPCCTQTQVKAPRVPNFKQDSLSICWKDCSIESIGVCRAAWSGPTPPENCRNYSKRLRLFDAAGTVKWNARVKFRYSRTWIETDPSGLERQIWRYLANGDLRPTAALGPAPCPRPPCAAANGNKVRFTGYVDYSLDCTGVMQEFSWMLTHACDAIDHAPGFPRAGVFHPDRTYSFVGPAAGFVVGALQPIEAGAGSLEAVRRIDRLPGTTIDVCEYDQKVQHAMAPGLQFCLCNTAAGVAQYVISDLTVTSACGTTVNTAGGPFLPGFISQGLGMWTSPLTYPGLEALRWNCGGYIYGDPCVGVVRDEVFFGVTTLRGWPAKQVPTAVDPGLPLPLTFVDQGNSLAGGTGTTMNRVYRSDHILNLNYD